MDKTKAQHMGVAPLVIRGECVWTAIDAYKNNTDIELFGATFKVIAVAYDCGPSGELSAAVELFQVVPAVVFERPRPDQLEEIKKHGRIIAP